MKKEIFFLTIILFGAFVVRLYKIDSPIADWHSWRQSDTSAVSRNFVKGGIDFFHPRFDDLSNIPSGKDNPQGYRFVEFPIYNAAVATFTRIFPQYSIEIWGRLVTIVSSLGSLVFLYFITKKYLGIRTGLLTSFFFAFTPFNIYYSRAILPDPSMVMAILGGTYFFDRWIENSIKYKVSSIKYWIWFLLSAIFVALAFLLKPYALFFTLPMAYLAFRKWGIRLVRKPQLWIFVILALVPLVFWRNWMQQYPEGIPVSDWLFNGGGIRFKGAFFYWLFADRIGRLILGYWGVAFLVIGIIIKRGEKEGWLFFSFLVSSLLYLTVIARGNVQHDYYQILIFPTLCIFLAKGADFLLSAPREYFSRVVCWLLLVACCLAMLGFGWYFVRDYFNSNEAIVTAGKAVDAFTPKNAKIIAPMEGDTSFLYQTNRQGWPSFQKPLEEMIAMGADYLVLTHPAQKDFDGFGKTYKIVSTTSDYILFNLKEHP